MKNFKFQMILIVFIILFLQQIFCEEAQNPCLNPKNKIIEENCKPGQSSEEWDINGSGHPSIQGFATDISKNKGQKIQFKVKTDSKNYKIDIYRLGYYNGKGARLQDTIYPKVDLPQEQPECIREDDTWLVDCGNWEVSAEWNIPYKSVSGLYIARLTRLDEPEQKNWRTDKSSKLFDQLHHVAGTDPYDPPKKDKHSYGAIGMGELRNKLKEPYASHIYFIVRDDFNSSDILLQTLDTTWQAYNGYGGYTTYGSFDYPYTHFPHSQPMDLSDPNHALKRAYKASLNRPLTTRGYRDVNTPFSHEYPFIRFLEGNGYDVQYFTGLDADRMGHKIEMHKIYLSVGHDEYWSQAQRDIVEKARDNGVNLGFFSGNEVYWRIRWENSIVDDQPYRTMVCYKDTQSTIKLDPIDWTGTWRDNRDINPNGSQPENALTGTIFTVNAHRNDPLQVPYKYSKFRLWRHTEIENLKPGETKTLIQGILGHEWDSDIDNGYRPEGLIRLSETHIDNVQYVQDNGSVFDSATGTHHLVQYKKGNSLVFGAGTVGWSWGLDNHHDSEYGINAIRANKYNIRVGENLCGADKNIQQATINIFADMDVYPQNIYSHLTLSSKSTDKQKPELSITDIKYENNILQVKGIAMDFGGGQVAGVEISFTEGKWHPATELNIDGSFIFKWGLNEYDQYYDKVIQDYQMSCGQNSDSIQITVKARAIDDSSNIGPIQEKQYNIELENLNSCQQ